MITGSSLFDGILTVSVFLILTAFIVIAYLKNSSRTVIYILLLGFVLRVFISLDGYLHKWDERYHALVAKNLIENPLKPVLFENPPDNYDFKNWRANHIWLHKPPVPLWCMAISIHTFGVHEFSVRIPSILLSTLSALLIYLLAKNLWNRQTGLISAYLFSINGFILDLASGRHNTDHVDTIFLFFILFSLVLIFKFSQLNKPIYNVLAGIALAFAILSKWWVALLLVPLWVVIIKAWSKLKLLELSKNLLLFILPTIILTGLWLMYIHTEFPQEAAWESEYNFRHFLEPLEGHSWPWYYYFINIGINYGEFIYLPIIWMIYKTIKEKSSVLFMLGIWIFIPLVIFSFAQTKLSSYQIISAPAYFIITALFIQSLLNKENYQKLRKFSLLLSLVIFGLAIRYSFERIKPFQSLEIRNPEWSQQLKKGGKPPTDEDRSVEQAFYKE